MSTNRARRRSDRTPVQNQRAEPPTPREWQGKPSVRGAPCRTMPPEMKAAVLPAAALLLPLAPPALARAPDPAMPPEVRLERVEIRGRAPSEVDQRRESTAAKTIVGRDEIERYGDSTLSDVLKRLPGVTIGGQPGRGGEIRMRGMGGGYTQILVNGERLPGGVSIETLTPEQVERIEVLRAPTAETGAQAIAGTINIVLREDVRRRLNTVQATLGWADDRWQPALNWTRADRAGPFSYNLSGSVYRRDRADTVDAHTEASGTGSDFVRDEARRGRGLREGVHLGGRLQWRLGGGDTFALQPFVMVHSERDLQTTQITAGSAPYAASATHNRGHFALARTNAEWQLRLADGTKLELNGSVTGSESAGNSLRREVDLNGDESRTLSIVSDARERWASLRSKASRWFGDQHQVAAGAEFEFGARDEDRDTVQTRPLATPTTDLLADRLSADTLRTAVWGQDEWKVSPQWSLQGGLRWEAIRTRSEWLDGSWQSSRNRSAVWSPLFHLLWRPDEQAKDQVRLSLTRSYRAARPAQLTAQRIVSRDTDVNGTNTPTSPDRIGNPALRPELSTGVDLAYEHYLGGGGLLSASLFHRQISDYIRNLVFLDNGRYVTQPQNVGHARTSGIEFEAKLRPAELVPALDWPLDLRANLSFFRSSVDGVPGPDNRLDRQPSYTLNLGADYRLRQWPLQVGSSLTLQPSTALQVAADQRSFDGMRRVIDAYALWTFSPATALRLSVGNLWARSTVSETVYAVGGGTYRSRSVEDNTTLASLRLELKL